MPSYRVMTEAGLMVHRADVAPEMASDREIAGEPRGIIRIMCAWTKAPLGTAYGFPRQHGQVSHGMSPAAAAQWRAEIKTFPVSK
jgi:hypothetical protein